MDTDGGDMMKLDVLKVKLILARKELNQTDLAKKCGMRRQALNEIFERGSCTLKTLGKIAKALEVDVTEIIKED